MKNFLTIIILVLTITSCERNEESTLDYPYYQFSESEKNLLVNNNYEIGDILTYRNQNNETLNFRVIESEEKKANQYSPSTFSGGGGNLEAYYDMLILRLEIIENGTNYSCCDQINYIFSKSNNLFKFGFKFPLWNKHSSTIIDDSHFPIDVQLSNLNLNQLETLEIENTIYNRVILLQSESTEEINDSTNLEIFVNEVFYDIDFGIVQFNDLNGMVWKLIDE